VSCWFIGVDVKPTCGGGGGERKNCKATLVIYLPPKWTGIYIYNFVAFGALSVTLQIIKCKVSG